MIHALNAHCLERLTFVGSRTEISPGGNSELRTRLSRTTPRTDSRLKKIMSFGIYLTGFVVVIAGLIYGASLMHVPTHWIVVGGLVLVGLGILTGVKATRQKDSAT
jgi:hypothetical protein